MNRLSLMAGVHRPEGWKTLDCIGGVDYLAAIPPLPREVKAIQWDEIELIHGINMLYPWDAERLLREIRDVLVPGGLLVMEQPDFDKMLMRPTRPVEWFFGDPGPQYPAHMCKWAYSPASLGKLVLDCGFSGYEVKPAQHHVPARDFRLEVRR